MLAKKDVARFILAKEKIRLEVFNEFLNCKIEVVQESYLDPMQIMLAGLFSNIKLTSGLHTHLDPVLSHFLRKSSVL